MLLKVKTLTGKEIPITFDIAGSASKFAADVKAPTGKAPTGKAPASAANVATPANTVAAPVNPASTSANAATPANTVAAPVNPASTSANAAAAGASSSKPNVVAAGASSSKPNVAAAGASSSKPNVAAAGAPSSKPNVPVVPVKTDIRVIEIKQAIEEKEGIPPAQQRLIFGGVQMADDNFAIADYKIESGSVLHLVLALRGGDSGCAI
ncbi:hypothetical protein GGI19_003045 [Coemansia pectinata]|uniref:Ubiquitin-like domain-containing protein n=1 Tax=Coemansia pectinata TaxID=1052879 RepID=A0A9W8LAP2_9FUNG|nr:hypothetical protein GGI19_003045 [Coemansia pectinata]